MSGLSSMGSMAEGLQQAFEDFLMAYENPFGTKSWSDYLSRPLGAALDITSKYVTGPSLEHTTQEKLFRELKELLDLLFPKGSEEVGSAFFSYLVAFKLVKRINQGVTHYLDESVDSKEKFKITKEPQGRHFVDFYKNYSKRVSSATQTYEADIPKLLERIDRAITPEDFDQIYTAPSATTGPAYFGILFARLEESVWTVEQQRLFGIERSERPESSEVSVSGGGTATAMFNAMQEVCNTPAAGAAGRVPMAAPDLTEKPGAF